MRKVLICGFVVLLLLPILSNNILAYPSEKDIPCEQKSIHAPIYINGDNNFTSENGVISGNGTAGNPFVICDWEISCDGTTDAIAIINTSAHVIIKNLYLTSTICNYSGILIDNATNITINNVTITKFARGIVAQDIYCDQQYALTIINCTIFNCTNEGIWGVSSNMIVKNCQIFNNSDGIIFTTSWAGAPPVKNEVIENTIYNNTGTGISGASSASKNRVFNNHVGIVNCERVIGNSVYRNAGDGICGGGYAGIVEENCIYENNGNGIYLFSDYVLNYSYLIRNNIIFSNLGSGVFFEQPSYCGGALGYGQLILEIVNNTIQNNGGTGISVRETWYYVSTPMSSIHKVIERNIVENNSEGIALYHAQHFVITRNIIKNNANFGLNLTVNQTVLPLWPCGNITIYGNFFINNTANGRQAHDDLEPKITPGNYWNTTTCGNYWSDWDWPDTDGDGIVDYPYPIEGNARAFDFKPLTLKNITLVATAGNKCVNLTWYNTFWANYTNVMVYRSTDHVNYTCIAETNDTTYLDTDVVNGVNYSYYIVLMNNTTEVVRSNTVFAMPVGVPSAPQNFTVRGHENKIELHWDAPATSEGSEIVKYRIYRRLYNSNNTPFFYAEVSKDTHTFTDTKVVNNITYFYCVAAVNGAGEGNNTSVLAATLSNLSVAIKVTPGTLGSGENASVEVKVTKYADGVAVENASVTLASENISGYFSNLTGYTDANGTFVARFYAGNVERNASGRIFAMVHAYGYSDVIAGTELNVQAQVGEKKTLVVGIELNSTAVVAGDSVSLDVWVQDARTGEFVNATIDVNVTNKEIVEVENITPEGTGRWQITMKIPANASGATVVLDITAHAAGYENASAHFAFCVGERSSASADYLPWEIALAMLVFVIAVLGAKLLMGRKRHVRKF